MTRYLLIALALSAAASVTMWHLYRGAANRAAVAEAALKVRDANEVVVTKYVEKIVKVPGPERIRTVVDRMCERPGVSGAEGADGAAAPDADFRPDSGGVAADIRACEMNRLQLEHLQDALRGQVK